MTQAIDKLKSQGLHTEAGAEAFKAGMPRDSYGCHFGMRSDRERAILAYQTGWVAAKVEAEQAAKAPATYEPAASVVTRRHVAPGGDYLVTWGTEGREQLRLATAGLAAAWAEANATLTFPATIYTRDEAGAWAAQVVTHGARVPGTMAPR